MRDDELSITRKMTVVSSASSGTGSLCEKNQTLKFTDAQEEVAHQFNEQWDDERDAPGEAVYPSRPSEFPETHHHHHNPKVPWPVYLYSFCAALNSCNLGYDLGVSTTAGPLLAEDLHLTNTQLEMLLGSLNFWSIFGALLSPVLSDRYGRRVTFAVAACGFIVGIAVQVVGTSPSSFEVLMVGRMIVGLAVGVGEAVDPMYIAEIAPKDHRGQLVSWAEAGVATGVVLGFCSSFLTDDWRIMIGAGAVLPTIMLALVKWVLPESPRWLYQQHQELAAKVLMQRLYSDDEEQVQEAMQEMQDSLAVQEQAEQLVGWHAILFPSPAVQRMLVVGIGISTIQQACGIDSVMFYLLFVIRGTGIQSKTGETIALVILGTVKLLFVFVGAHLLDVHGRRPLLISSLIGCAASLLLVSFTFLSDSTASNYLTILGLASFLAWFSSGLGPGNWVVVSEIFATSIRAKAMCVAVLPNRITATIMASTFLTLSKLLTWPGFFLLLVGICLLGALFVYVYLPETKGKSLEEMAGYFAEITGDRSLLDLEAKLKHRVNNGRIAVLEGGDEGGDHGRGDCRDESSKQRCTDEIELVHGSQVLT